MRMEECTKRRSTIPEQNARVLSRQVLSSVLTQALGLFKVLIQVGHERRAAGANGGGIARMGLMLSKNVPLSVPDVNLPELRE